MFMYEGEGQACLIAEKSGYKKTNPVHFSAALTPDAFISAYRCGHQQVDFFSNAHTAKMVYNNLSSDIINPAKLIDRCCTDNFTGYIEAGNGPESKRMYIYFHNGGILGTMNISDNEGVFESNTKESTIQDKILNTSINLFKLSKDIRDTQKDREQLILCYEQIFQMLEDRAAGKDFSSIWRKCALDLSDTFVFLDPFAGEFNYKYRQIDIWEKINIKTAIHGIDKLVGMIAKQLAVPEGDIKAVKNNHIEILADYEIRH